jgi:hypothetical protein
MSRAFHASALARASLLIASISMVALSAAPSPADARPRAASSIHRGGGGGGMRPPAGRPDARINNGGSRNGNFNRGGGNNNGNNSGNRINNGNVHIGNNNINVDVDDHWDHGWNYHPVATGVAIGTAAAITSAAIGSMIYSLPPSCRTIVSVGVSYYQCGSVWYQPQYAGSSVTYVVVNPPR